MGRALKRGDERVERSAMPRAKLDVPYRYEKEFDDPSETIASFRSSGIREKAS